MSSVTITYEEPLVTISLEEYESLKETIEVLKDRAVLYDIRKAREDLKAGRTKSLEEVEKAMGWDKT